MFIISSKIVDFLNDFFVIYDFIILLHLKTIFLISILEILFTIDLFSTLIIDYINNVIFSPTKISRISKKPKQDFQN